MIHATPQPRPTPASRGARRALLRFAPGLTQVELLLGLVITSLCLLALSAFMVSTAQAWKSADQVQIAQLINLQSANRVQETVRSAKYLGWAGQRSDNTGSALLFWREDSNNDGRLQLGEIALLEHNAAAGTLTLFTLPGTSSAAVNLCDNSDIDQEGDVAVFKSLSNLKSQVVVKGVKEVTFSARDPNLPTQRPSLDFKIRSERDGKSYGESQSVAVRAPRGKPVRCDSAASCACIKTGCVCSAPGACGCGGDVACRTLSGSKCKATIPTAFSSTTSATAN